MSAGWLADVSDRRRASRMNAPAGVAQFVA